MFELALAMAAEAQMLELLELLVQLEPVLWAHCLVPLHFASC